jgi:anti-anti-sigma factor
MNGRTRLLVDTSDPRRTIAHIFGRLDLAGTGAIELALAETVAAHTHVAVDLSRVDYISPVGLRLLILAERSSAKRGRLKIVNPQAHVAQILCASGFGNVIRIAPASDALKRRRRSLKHAAESGGIEQLRLVPQPSRRLDNDTLAG